MVSPTDEIGPIFGHFIHLSPSGGQPGTTCERLLTPKGHSANQNLIPHTARLFQAMRNPVQYVEIQRLRKLTSERVPSDVVALLNSPIRW
jgi:hypothetical protein